MPNPTPAQLGPCPECGRELFHDEDCPDFAGATFDSKRKTRLHDGLEGFGATAERLPADPAPQCCQCRTKLTEEGVCPICDPALVRIIDRAADHDGAEA